MNKPVITMVAFVFVSVFTFASNTYACYSDYYCAQDNYRSNLSTGAYPSVAGNAYMRDLYGSNWMYGTPPSYSNNNISTPPPNQNSIVQNNSASALLSTFMGLALLKATIDSARKEFKICNDLDGTVRYSVDGTNGSLSSDSCATWKAIKGSIDFDCSYRSGYQARSYLADNGNTYYFTEIDSKDKCDIYVDN